MCSRQKENMLLTGASGYIGNYFMSQYNDKYKFHIFSLLNHELVNIDFCNIYVVIHCAALVHQKVKYSYEKYYEVNVDYPIKLATLAKQKGVSHFVFMSTIAVYDETMKVVSENSQFSPSTHYGKSKLEAERQLSALVDENFKVSIVRPPMVYGDAAPGNIKSLIRLIEKVSILPFGGINNKRSFVYVGNLCAMIDKIIETSASGVFLASDDRSLSTTELIELIASAKHKKVYLLDIPFFPTLLKWLKPSLYKRLFENLEIDNTLTKQLLGFQNPYSIEEGIKKMIYGDNQ